MSLGGSGSDGACNSDALHLAICNSVNAGITYVVSAGNSNADMAGFVPAAFDQVLTVTALADFNGQPGGGERLPVVQMWMKPRQTLVTSPQPTVRMQDIRLPDPVCVFSPHGKVVATIPFPAEHGSTSCDWHRGDTVHCSRSMCWHVSSSQVIAKLRNDGQAQGAAYGFAGNPRLILSPVEVVDPRRSTMVISFMLAVTNRLVAYCESGIFRYLNTNAGHFAWR